MLARSPRHPRSVSTVPEERKPSEIPYLHARPPRRVVGEADPLAKVTATRAGLLRLREQVDAAPAADEGRASSATYRETDERR